MLYYLVWNGKQDGQSLSEIRSSSECTTDSYLDINFVLTCHLVQLHPRIRSYPSWSGCLLRRRNDIPHPLHTFIDRLQLPSTVLPPILSSEVGWILQLLRTLDIIILILGWTTRWQMNNCQWCDIVLTDDNITKVDILYSWGRETAGELWRHTRACFMKTGRTTSSLKCQNIGADPMWWRYLMVKIDLLS